MRFVEALKMIFSLEENRYFQFKDEDCFRTSLLRNASMNAYGLSLGKEIMFDETSSYDLAEIPLMFYLPEEQGQINFDFSSNDFENNEDIDLPSRMLVCIGNNGAGKSTILYRLARILFATPSARQSYADKLGRIDPPDVGFRRLFLISYSAFDNFVLPGVGKDDYKLILEGLQNRNGRLVYCGIRDVETEYRILKLKGKTKNQDEQSEEMFDDEDVELLRNNNPLDNDHGNIHKLKTVEGLAKEFVDAYLGIAKIENQRSLWNKLMSECQLANSSLEDMTMHHPAYLYDSDVLKNKFKSLSTGIKYLLHSLSNILDRVEQNSIIIFDEPENHVQPPLLCKFLYCLRIISQRYKSLVLVATHSPVILQETLAKNVIVVNRNGSNWNFRRPSIETYGENIGIITDEVFNLNTSVTNYHKTAEQILTLFRPKKIGVSSALEYLSYIHEKTKIDFGREIKAFLISNFLKSNK